MKSPPKQRNRLNSHINEKNSTVNTSSGTQSRFINHAIWSKQSDQNKDSETEKEGDENSVIVKVNKEVKILCDIMAKRGNLVVMATPAKTKAKQQ